MAMDTSETDKGVIYVLWKRFETQRYPRVLEPKKKMDAGEPLSDEDLEFLGLALSDAKEIQPVLDRHPEYRPLVKWALSLCTAITNRALENDRLQSKAGSPRSD